MNFKSHSVFGCHESFADGLALQEPTVEGLSERNGCLVKQEAVLFDTDDMFGTAALKYTANSLAIACCNKDNIEFDPFLYHKLL